jgi:hypothetical protein
MLILSTLPDYTGPQRAVRLSLGCEKSSTSAPPTLWDSVDLWAFHCEASAKNARCEMATSGIQRQYLKLRIIIRAENALGKHMFVVDIEQEQNNNGLAVPKEMNQGNPTSFDDEDITDAPQPVSHAGPHHKSLHKDELEIGNPEAEFPGWRL